MRLEEVPTLTAEGTVLAHSHRLGAGHAFKKGRTLSAQDCAALAAGGITRVLVARLDGGDLGEDEAARRVAEAIAGANVAIAPATTGRANILASTRGVLVVSRPGVEDVNLVDEAIAVATLVPYSVVERGAMVATVKIIPFAVPADVVERARARGAVHAPLLTVAPLRAKRAGLIMTTLPGVRDEQLARAAKNQELRMAYLRGELVRSVRVPHDRASIAGAIDALVRDGLDLVMVLGASAIIDRRDVIPTAIEAAGGTVDHLGMPVDPGNLLLLGRKGHVPIVGVPGCARSLERSGFDAVLERLCADLPVTRHEIMRMGVGGLLAEAPERPSPRRGRERKVPVRVAAIVLAAGMSRRMGGANKLLANVDGAPMIARVVDTFLASKAQPVFVVVGHQGDRVRAALGGRNVKVVENPAYEEGLGASLRAGIEALDEIELDGALVALGDMPWVRPEHVDELIDAFDPLGSATICVPVHDRKRGHPVLWSSRHFAEMRKLGGDMGARGLLERHAGAVLTVQVGDPAVHLDVDTPDMLERRT